MQLCAVLYDRVLTCTDCLLQALAECSRRRYAEEQAFLLGRMGDFRGAMAVTLEEIGDVPGAVAYARDVADEDVFEELFSVACRRPALVSKPLNAYRPAFPSLSFCPAPSLSLSLSLPRFLSLRHLWETHFRFHSKAGLKRAFVSKPPLPLPRSPPLSARLRSCLHQRMTPLLCKGSQASPFHKQVCHSIAGGPSLHTNQCANLLLAGLCRLGPCWRRRQALHRQWICCAAFPREQ